MHYTAANGGEFNPERLKEKNHALEGKTNCLHPGPQFVSAGKRKGMGTEGGGAPCCIQACHCHTLCPSGLIPRPGQSTLRRIFQPHDMLQSKYIHSHNNAGIVGLLRGVADCLHHNAACVCHI